MVFEFFRGGSNDAIADTQELLVHMLLEGNDVFETASDALFGGGKAKATKKEIRSTDKGINEMQAEIRRKLMLQVSVNPADMPLVLQYASIVKDAERVGDYAKNLYDLVKYGQDFDAAADRDELIAYRDNVSRLIVEAAEVFGSNDEVRAQELLDKADGFLDEYDKKVKEQVVSDAQTSDAVARALYFRFLKRTTAHVMNVLTALVQPLDRLDYYDEAKEDR